MTLGKYIVFTTRPFYGTEESLHHYTIVRGDRVSETFKLLNTDVPDKRSRLAVLQSRRDGLVPFWVEGFRSTTPEDLYESTSFSSDSSCVRHRQGSGGDHSRAEEGRTVRRDSLSVQNKILRLRKEVWCLKSTQRLRHEGSYVNLFVYLFFFEGWSGTRFPSTPTPTSLQRPSVSVRSNVLSPRVPEK